MPTDWEKVEKGARAYAKDQADIYFYNGPVDEQGYGALVVSLHARRTRKEKAVLILVTSGGAANSAYRIARLFQDLYKDFTVYVPSYCKSAGTLVVLGAHGVIMSQFAELGPLDVQLLKADELGERRSGLINRAALTSLAEHSFTMFEDFLVNTKRRSGRAVRFKTAADLAASLTSQLLGPLIANIDPLTVGEDHRDLAIAAEYGNRLCAASKNAKTGAVNRLVHDYPSHDFVIDHREAASLFVRIEAPSAELYSLTAALGELGMVPHSTDVTARYISVPQPAPERVVEGVNDGQGSEDQTIQRSAD